ncbi:hypothetical protein ACJJTC_006099 [Scirpophaga incertulas]
MSDSHKCISREIEGSDCTKKFNDLTNKEYRDLYKEMMKSYQESMEEMSNDGSELRKIFEENNREIFRRGNPRDLRSSKLLSSAERRRVRSQALRREKLQSQSLHSHFEHMRLSKDDLSIN